MNKSIVLLLIALTIISQVPIILCDCLIYNQLNGGLIFSVPITIFALIICLICQPCCCISINFFRCLKRRANEKNLKNCDDIKTDIPPCSYCLAPSTFIMNDDDFKFVEGAILTISQRNICTWCKI